MSFIYVALGGALGSICRYSISLLPFKGQFPLLTLTANFIGAFCIGYLASTCSDKKMNLFFKTGFCGGFTTFSTFSLESYNLLKNGSMAMGFVYMGLSLALCLCGVALGFFTGIKIKGE